MIRTILLFTLIVSSLSAKMYWVFFTDSSTRPRAQLTEKATLRLQQRGVANRLGDKDVSRAQLAELRNSGYKIRTVSRFLNAASLDVENSAQLQKLKKLPFVLRVAPVASWMERTPLDPISESSLFRRSVSDYGLSSTQNDILKIPTIHDYGYDGAGVLVAVFDTGFNIEHPAFNSIDVVDVYDFVEKDDDPYRYGADEHGSQVLSVMAGYYPGELIGPAYGASFLLARTENVASETRVEEDNWVAAMEWADSLGVDIISASLNYRDFDGTAEDYPDEALDGQTAIVTRAANIAASRGILVVNSMGNEGPSAGSLWHPADSPHVLSVGAIHASGDITNFSSRGPTFDGRRKPEVVAMGSSVYMMQGEDTFRTGQGTSYSTPQVAGLAALLLQAHPSLGPDSVITLFRENSNRSDNPDNTYGYGVPDLVSLFTPLDVATQGIIYPNPSISRTVRMSLPKPVAAEARTARLFDIRGRFLAYLNVHFISDDVVELELPPSSYWASQLFIVSVDFGEMLYSGKFVFIKS